MEKQHIMQILWLKWYPQMQELERRCTKEDYVEITWFGRAGMYQGEVDGLRREDWINT